MIRNQRNPEEKEKHNLSNIVTSIKPIFFKTQSDFREWLEKNHKTEKEIFLGYYKVGSGKKGISWPESVDEALCFGWIDGIRRSIDNESYCNRFTPRRLSSNWSAVNIKKVEELIRQGLMQPEGLRLFNNRKEEKSEVYSYENQPEKLPDYLEAKFVENSKAWIFFNTLPPSYKKTRIYLILSAKQEATRISRLEKLIEACEQQKRLY